LEAVATAVAVAFIDLEGVGGVDVGLGQHRLFEMIKWNTNTVYRKCRKGEKKKNEVLKLCILVLADGWYYNTLPYLT